jgi:hypothetical protein
MRRSSAAEEGLQGRRRRRWPQAIDPAQDLGEQRPGRRHPDQLEHDYRPWRTILAPIFTSFSCSVVSDHCSIPCGRAKVRMKLARL